MKIKTKVISFLLLFLTLISSLTLPAYAYYGLSYTINYTDEEGNILHEPETGEINMEVEKLNVISPEIEGYSLKYQTDEKISYSHLNIVHNPSQYYRFAEGSYTVVYRKNYEVRISYIYSDRTKIKEDYVFSGPAGTEFNIKSDIIEGYTCDKPYVSGEIEGDYNYTVTYYPNRYTITYHRENGTPDTSTGKGHNVKIKVINEIPVSGNGYFVYWYDYENNKSYRPGEYIEENRDINLYAVYEKNKINITYNGNGGVCTIGNQVKEYGVDIMLSTDIPYRDGYSFSGWGTDEYSTSPSYSPGDIYTLDLPLNLYAIWSKISSSTPIYLISYSGEGGSNIPENQLKEYNVDTYISSQIPVKPGYSFICWNDPEGESYLPGSVYTRNSSLYLSAVYSPLTVITYYTVTYDANGGEGAPEPESESSEYSVVISSIKPHKQGYVFWGWSKRSNSESPEYLPGDVYSELKDITLYAVYIKEELTYHIVYNANGGRFGIKEQIKKHDVPLTLTYDTPRRDEYIFKYWCTKKDGSGNIYYPETVYENNESVTLYAIWEEDFETYYVVYDLMGGYAGPSYDIKKEGHDMHITPVIPKKDGYLFTGWCKERYGEISYYPYDLYTEDHDLVLYAQYITDPEIYHITYNVTGGVNAPENQIKYAGRTEYISLTIPEKTGYEFMYWTNNPFSEEIIFTPGEEYTDDSDLYLYAVWEFLGYDFEITNMELSSYSINPGDSIGIKVYIKNLTEQCSPKLEILYDRIVIFSENIFLNADSGNLIEFEYKTKSSESGEKEIKARINSDFMYEETDYSNNEKSKSVMLDPKGEISIAMVNNLDGYIEGEDVFTSVYLENESGVDILPHNNLKCTISIYRFDSEGNKEYVTNEFTQEHIPVPVNEKNLVYYRWHVCDGLGGENLFVHIDASCEGLNLYDDITFNVKVKKNPDMTCKDTKFEKTPESYYKTTKASYRYSLEYSTYDYENGMFLKREHKVYPEPSPVIYPGANTPYYRDEEGLVYIKSGYPIGVLYTIYMDSGEDTPYILPEKTVCMYPEYMFEQSSDTCDTLEKVANLYILPAGEDKSGLHYIPVWQEDGKYSVFVYSGIIKTPGGNVSCMTESNGLYIQSNLFTDWYVGGKE